MKKSDPDFLTPRMVSTFIDRLSKQIRVSMVLFDDKPRLLMPLTSLSDDGSGQIITTGLEGIDYSGQYTNMPVGIERAIYELRVNGRENAPKGIVFITDGIVDTGNPRKDEELTRWLKQELTQQSRNLGIRIFAIALTDDADFSLIQTLAARTDGEYFRAYEVSEISSVFDRIESFLAPVVTESSIRTIPPEIEPMEAINEIPATQPVSLISERKPPVETPLATASSQVTASGDKTVVVIEKGTWMMKVLVIVVVSLLVMICVFFFFFYKNSKRRAPVPAPEEKKLNIPQAHLEDEDDIRPAGQGLMALDKERICIGRGQRNDIILDQPAISGFHATIEFRNMSFYLEDQRSTNGTMLNDRRLSPNEPVRLKSGDNITFAKFHFKFIIADQKPFGDTIMLSMTALSDPEAESTMVLDLDGSDSKQGLISCMQNHLLQIYGLGPKYKDFVSTYFTHDILDLIATAVHENLQRTKKDQEQHCTTIVKNETFYLACSLPVAISAAAEWFGQRNQGFTQYVLEWLKTDQYQSAQCNQLCIVTFGQDPATWVSITVVPTHSDPDPVEIMSVDFLNEEEKSSLALDFDHHGRVI